MCFIFFFNDTATTEIYTLSLHDALPISAPRPLAAPGDSGDDGEGGSKSLVEQLEAASKGFVEAKEALDRSKKRQQERSEEHTSELQSRQYLVCRLLLEKKKNTLHTSEDA